jgi:hypothetical protein
MGIGRIDDDLDAEIRRACQTKGVRCRRSLHRENENLAV